MIDGCATCSARARGGSGPAPPRRAPFRREGCGSRPDARARGARRDGPCCRDGRARALHRSRRCRAGRHRPERRSVDADRVRRRHRAAERRHVRPPILGGFASARPTATSSQTGSPGRRRSDAAAPERCADTTAIGSVPSNGSRPVTSSKITTPRRIDVRARVDDAAGQLLRRRIGHRADELMRSGEPRLIAVPADVGDAEIDDLVDALAGAQSRARRCWPASGRDE